MSDSLATESLFLDLSDRAKLRLTGADRLRFLNGQVSNDVRLAQADASIYTGVMTIKGKLCADAFVHADSAESLLLDTEPELREALLARLDRYIVADDVQIEDVTEHLGLLHLLDFTADTGAPHAASLPAALHTLASQVQVVRSLRLGRPGLDLFFAAAMGQEVRARVHTAGFTLLNEDGAESLRVRAGVPQWGAELDENTLPAEAGIEERGVSYSKGCYIGQEVVSRVKSVGHVNRHLCGLRALDASPLYPGMILFPSPEDGAEPVPAVKPVGTITSAAPSAGHGGAAYLALGYVRRGSDAAGNRLLAVPPPDPGDASDAAPPASCPVEVCPLPFIQL